MQHEDSRQIPYKVAADEKPFHFVANCAMFLQYVKVLTIWQSARLVLRQFTALLFFFDLMKADDVLCVPSVVTGYGEAACAYISAQIHAVLSSEHR